ncbi:NAD(P)-binding protein [Coccomyxa subellipsoidea C-169]|uniref:NAD(P)-binding protein n=1 Tax=Coccomyxa subellipsoidea (strain C-169) TaxID=574566 RepID=I0YTL3_COCSC|nr:NAD(P)-binding protein [Coccomyxa subellipsoidea C-169]EIE21732.1 NAD(P)-binding protein [Coccomyxa subellipsoidea C-169]|eukprot:XP_005646276.1 NAD(P)-binding protein [Coccomyxa subellipsoidea C-169]
MRQVEAPSTGIGVSRSGKDLQPPYNVVITGGTKGVGRALAKEFLRAGDSVVICSRDSDRVNGTVRELDGFSKAEEGAGRIKGKVCNMAKPGDVASFANYARDTLGTVDLWINNAGSNGYKYKTLAESSDADLINIVETNVLGTMLGCKEAIRVMRDQRAGGHIFNMDGAGADGGATPRFAAYGATKRGLMQLSKSLQAELKMLNINNVGIHNLSPGMVTTDLLMAGADTATAKFFINCLADPPEEVAAYLVPRIRRVPLDSRTLGGAIGQGSYIKYLTKSKAYGQILARLLTGARKDRFVPEE